MSYKTLVGLLFFFGFISYTHAVSVITFEPAKPMLADRWLFGFGFEYAVKDFEPLQEPYIQNWQNTDFAQKITLGRSYIFYSIAQKVELQIWWAALHVLVPRVYGDIGGPKNYVGDLVVGFKWLLFDTQNQWGQTSFSFPGHLSLKLQTKAPNADEKWLIGTNNTDVAFGFLYDYFLSPLSSLQLYSGFNIVADPRRPNSQDDLLDFKIAYSWLNQELTLPGIAWLRRIDLGLQGYRGYYRKHDLKVRAFAKLSWALDHSQWQQNKGWELATTFTSQIVGDKADLFEQFFFTENFRTMLVLNYLF